MIIGRFIGWLLVLAALIVFVRDLIGWLDLGSFHSSVLGELWHEAFPESLALAQPAIQRHIAPWLWDPVIVTVLLWPAALVLGVPGVALVTLCRRRERRRRR